MTVRELVTQGIVGGLLGGVFMMLINRDWTGGVRAFPVSSGLEGFVVTDGYPLVVWLVMVLVGAFVGAVGSGTAASRFLDV